MWKKIKRIFKPHRVDCTNEEIQNDVSKYLDFLMVRNPIAWEEKNTKLVKIGLLVSIPA